jgi:hypothetical protein
MSFLVDATRPFASSFIKQNLQFAQDRFNSLNSFPVGADKDGNIKIKCWTDSILCSR